MQKAKAVLQQDVSTSLSQGRDPEESLKWQQAAGCEILPDSILQRVISSPIYSAITYPLKQQEQQLQQFCVRAWLGVSEGSPQEVLCPIIQGKDTLNEAYFSPSDVVSLPRKTRIQLYR